MEREKIDVSFWRIGRLVQVENGMWEGGFCNDSIDG